MCLLDLAYSVDLTPIHAFYCFAYRFTIRPMTINLSEKDTHLFIHYKFNDRRYTTISLISPLSTVLNGLAQKKYY